MNASSIAPPSEAEPLLPLVAAGDRDAVRRCIGRYGPLLMALARRMTPTAADAEDALQEVFVEVWRAAGRFDPVRGSEPAFVVTIARRRLIDRLRSERVRRSSEQPLEEETLDTLAADATPAELGPDAEQAARALATLPAEQKRIILLAVVEGFSHSEIAHRLGMPLGTVKTLVRRGLIRVRELLEPRPRVPVEASR